MATSASTGGTTTTANDSPLWLEVSNIRVGGAICQVQLRADREPDRVARWWPLPPTIDAKAAADQFKAVSEALEKKRPVLAQLVGDVRGLRIDSLAIQYAETIR
jgi:hypothetical protein